MLYFENDYSEGASPKFFRGLWIQIWNIYPAMALTATQILPKIKSGISAAARKPKFIFWWRETQTNQTVIDSVLKNYEGVIAAETGHVSVHEAGAIEFTGHKVLTLPQHDGKLCARELKDYMEFFWEMTAVSTWFFREWYIFVVLLNGTLYTKDELKELSQVCRRFKLPLYMDSASLPVSPALKMNCRFLILLICAIFFTSAVPKPALCRRSCCFYKK